MQDPGFRAPLPTFDCPRRGPKNGRSFGVAVMPPAGLIALHITIIVYWGNLGRMEKNGSYYSGVILSGCPNLWSLLGYPKY